MASGVNPPLSSSNSLSRTKAVPTSDCMPAEPILALDSETPLQLVLFIDRRPSSFQKLREIRNYLLKLHEQYPFDLQIVDVAEQPYLAEYFKLVATPALLKIHPEPRQILAGSNLVAEVEKWWSRWQREAQEYQSRLEALADSEKARHRSPEAYSGDGESDRSPTHMGVGTKQTNSLAETAQLMRLSDEIFQLKQEKEQLAQQLRFKDHLIAMLAHDLRNPLTAASIAIETLEMCAEPDHNPKKMPAPGLFDRLIKHARTQIRGIENLITDVLEASKGTNAQFHLKWQQLDMGAICQEVLATFSSRFQEKSLQLETDIPNDLPLAYADPDRIRQVLVNLLDNACKYTPAGGKIQVVILHRTTNKLQISVCDNGPGIPPENQQRIFEDHFRLHRDQKEDGYGIGLSVCKRLILAHYGQIWVDSVPGSGSSFHFLIWVDSRRARGAAFLQTHFQDANS
ncbi:MAG: histidine kinase [Oscillatoriaceae cyanobacterium]